MKTKQLAIMVAVAAILGGAAFFLNRKGDPGAAGGAGAGAKVIELPLNDVANVLIQSATGKLSLVKKDDVWAVEDRAGYPANFERIHDLLRKLWDLKTVQVVPVGQSQFSRLELAEPLVGAGTKIEFKDKDGKSLGALLFGKKHMKESPGGMGGMGGEGGFPVGRYVMPAGGSRVSLVSETLDEVDAKPESWLSHDFFKIENPSSVTLAGTTDAQKWKLTRENATAEWKLADAKPDEKVDTGKVSPVGTAFANPPNPPFADVLAADAKPADTGLDKPAVITVETFDGFTYVLKAGKETNGNQPLTVEVSGKFATERTPGKDEKPEEKTKLDDDFKKKIKGFEDKLAAEKKFEGRAFLVAKSTVDQVVKDRAALLADKPAEPAPGAPPPGVSVPGAPPGFPGVRPPAPPGIATPPVAVPPPAKPPGASAKPPQKPVTATTPPVSVPPAKPERKPVTATTPPVTVPIPTKPEQPKPEAPKPTTPPGDAPKPAPPAPPPVNTPPPAK